MQKAAFFLTIISLFLFACGGNYIAPSGQKAVAPPTHQLFDSLLRQYVTINGKVDYQGFLQDSLRLNKYLAQLNAYPPAEDWSEAERLAFWINAYNAFTIKLITDNYPLESIRELHALPSFPLIGSVWHKPFFQVGDQPISLNDVEHNILRKDFNEPRIHFAIVCASNSCPQLRTEAFTADKLEGQLTEQARAFLADDFRNQISQDEIKISRIFQWFGGDFKKEGTLIEFLNQYAEVEIDKKAKISYLKYDWGLNK